MTQTFHSLGRRAALLLLGSLISTVCYAATIQADLGLGPLYAVQEGVALHAGITLGRAVMLVGVGLVLLAIVLRQWPGPGTIALPFIGGATLDALLPHMPEVNGLVLRLVVVMVASWTMALGGALMIRAAIGVAALDAVMLGIHKRVPWTIRQVRLAMEGSMLVAGFVLGGSIGVGTVITGLLIGPGLHYWLGVLSSTKDDHVTTHSFQTAGG